MSNKTKSTKAPTNLLIINKDYKNPRQPKIVTFYNLVAKTLYTNKRARPDTCTAINFLTMRVRSPDEDYWRKLVWLMHYLIGTRKLPLILSANGSRILKWWVYAYFVVHPKMRGHSGGGLSMSRRFPIVSSTKQNLNTRRSTESEI